MSRTHVLKAHEDLIWGLQPAQYHQLKESLPMERLDAYFKGRMSSPVAESLGIAGGSSQHCPSVINCFHDARELSTGLTP